MPFLKLLFSLLLIIIVHAAVDWHFNQPEDAGVDVPSGKLRSLSFAPFREGYSPLEKKYPIAEHIEEDIRLLADKTQTIRTYSSLGGMQPTPELARRYGLNMLQGAWISDTARNNRLEVDALIQSANANPDVVKRVIVGNEVLLRGELDVDKLIMYIREVKKAVKQPVSYADVWSMYMKHPQLFAEVDFITIHILPYWEDEPIAVDNATEHLEKIVRQVENEARGIAPGKPILIGESGWPSAGRQRGQAIPGVVNEAKFIRGMIQVAEHHGFDYNIVEAFNQPWKSNLEGVVGANWGLFSADRQPIFPLTGPVQEHADWLKAFMAASALLLLLVGVFSADLKQLSALQQLFWLVWAQWFSVDLVNLLSFEWYTSYSLLQRIYTLVLVVANAVIVYLVLCRLLDGFLERSSKTTAFLFKTYRFFLLLAVYKTLLLAIRGRYLSFPVEQFLIPALGVVALSMAGSWLNRRFVFSFFVVAGTHDQYDGRWATAVFTAVLVLILGETYAFMDGRDFILAHPGFIEGLPVALKYTLCNQQLVNWIVCLLVIALPFWANHRCYKAAQIQ